MTTFFLWMGYLPALAETDDATNAVPANQTNVVPDTQPCTNPPSKFFDPKDGWLDVSHFLDGVRLMM